MGNIKIGLQLYSIRDKMGADIEKALKTVKEIGYDYVEMAGYFDKSAEEIRELLDKYGLKCISVHQMLDFYEEKGNDGIEFVKKLGAEYTAIPWYHNEKFVNDFDGVSEYFKKIGKQLKDGGLQMLYHNHDFEFVKVVDKLIIDKLYEAVSSEYLNPEFDTCWVKYSGYDPIEYIEKYKGRVQVIHLKDFWCKDLNQGPVYGLIDENGNETKPLTQEERGFEYRPLGDGIQDIKGILEIAEKSGTEYAIVEQDFWHENDSMECAKKSREYLKSIGY